MPRSIDSLSPTFHSLGVSVSLTVTMNSKKTCGPGFFPFNFSSFFSPPLSFFKFLKVHIRPLSVFFFFVLSPPLSILSVFASCVRFYCFMSSDFVAIFLFCLLPRWWFPHVFCTRRCQVSYSKKKERTLCCCLRLPFNLYPVNVRPPSLSLVVFLLLFFPFRFFFFSL